MNQGIWRKYPNRECAHVISVDVLDRSIDPKTGVLRTERVLGVRQKAPLWVLKVRSAPVFGYEELVSERFSSCLVDPNKHLFERSPSLIPQQNEQHSRAKTSPFLNTSPSSRKYPIHPHMNHPRHKRTSTSRYQFALARLFGNHLVAGWSDGVPRGSLKMRRKDVWDSRKSCEIYGGED